MAEFKFGEYYKSGTRIFLKEATIVGFILILIFIFTSCILKCILKCIYDRKKNHNFHMILSIFISGYLFHLACEYSGLNVWYSKDYCEIIPNIK